METVEIPIKDAMTKNVKTITQDAEATKAARIMERNNIGCVVVVNEGLPVGIVTERDITYRVVAPNKLPSTVLLKDIMSKPVETAGPDITITQASKIMARHNLRRLPVIEKNKLIGIITNTDIVQVAPSQIEILRELSRMRDRASGSEPLERGTCENCGGHWVKLFEVNSSFVCDSCRDEMVDGESAKEEL